MSAAQPLWLSSASTERPSTFTLRLSNSGFSFATSPSSVVHTGVKSFGCENNTPLRESRDFRLLWTGEMISQVGSQITLVALFVQIYALTGSSAAVGAVGLVQLLPMVLVSLGFGPQIDVRDRRRILLGAQIGLLFASAVLLFGSHLHHPPLALLYSAAALNAAFVSISMPTRAA